MHQQDLSSIACVHPRCTCGRADTNAVVDDSSGKGAISTLQEFVQSSRGFHLPSRCPILHWNFASQIVGSSTLEFRAVAGFLLDGVPHYVVGSWLPSKKAAQRDAAEGSLNLFTKSWGGALTLGMRAQKPISRSITPSTAAGSDSESEESNRASLLSNMAALRKTSVQVLEMHCHRDPGLTAASLQWTVTWDDGLCEAALELDVHNVPHRFAAGSYKTLEDAYQNTACRVLWYLRHPDFINMYEVDAVKMVGVAAKLPSPPAQWMSSDTEESAMHAAERKTTVMRLQNRLQQVFSGRLKPGERVWEWSYEYDHKSENMPPLCRAIIHLAVLGRDFQGAWARGQRDAQILACEEVSACLDSMKNDA